MEGIADDTAIVVTPFGNYVDMDRGLAVCVSSWKRSDDNAIPGRAKITGNYVNSALAKNEAILNGYDEAIVLNQLGLRLRGERREHFPRARRRACDSIGRRRHSRGIYPQRGHQAGERMNSGWPAWNARSGAVSCTTADEIFLCGTGVQVAPITSVDRRRVGTGEVGPISSALQEHVFRRGDGRAIPSTRTG